MKRILAVGRVRSEYDAATMLDLRVTTVMVDIHQERDRILHSRIRDYEPRTSDGSLSAALHAIDRLAREQEAGIR